MKEATIVNELTPRYSPAWAVKSHSFKVWNVVSRAMFLLGLFSFTASIIWMFAFAHTNPDLASDIPFYSIPLSFVFVFGPIFWKLLHLNFYAKVVVIILILAGVTASGITVEIIANLLIVGWSDIRP